MNGLARSEFHTALSQFLNYRNEYSNLTVAASTDRAIHKRSDSAQLLLANSHFANVQAYTFTNYQELDLAGLIGRVRSNSYCPSKGVVFQQLILDLEKLHVGGASPAENRFQNNNVFVYLKYSTSLHLAEPFS